MKARKHFLTHIGIKSFCTTKISWFKLDEKVRLNFHKLLKYQFLALKQTGEKRDFDEFYFRWLEKSVIEIGKTA